VETGPQADLLSNEETEVDSPEKMEISWEDFLLDSKKI